MRGFIVGSLVLIGLYVAGGDTASAYLGGGLDTFSQIVRRLSDPTIAAIPQKGYHTSLQPAQTGGGGGMKFTAGTPGRPVLSV